MAKSASCVSNEIFVSPEEKFIVGLESHWHGEDRLQESVRIEVETDSLELSLSLPLSAFRNLVATGQRFMLTKKTIRAHSDGHCLEGEPGNWKSINRKDLSLPA